MEHFKSFVISKQIIPEKRLPYYLLRIESSLLFNNFLIKRIIFRIYMISSEITHNAGRTDQMGPFNTDLIVKTIDRFFDEEKENEKNKGLGQGQ